MTKKSKKAEKVPVKNSPGLFLYSEENYSKIFCFLKNRAKRKNRKYFYILHKK
ncbi:hypothetical protein C095_01385 [Fusobacterium necrophorum subsp. funduliforme B35]|uniref:Uncharacterized protein n=1 Tax=Fusobacterium necrophorum subsp. funduliforme B35 TaxID=1226633 RepID=A0A0B4ESR5_9FUSO|nr:hypothetical protein C095_01385 [Fusobacterium necrophorum subsp. funduliforme B35]